MQNIHQVDPTKGEEEEQRQEKGKEKRKKASRRSAYHMAKVKKDQRKRAKSKNHFSLTARDKSTGKQGHAFGLDLNSPTLKKNVMLVGMDPEDYEQATSLIPDVLLGIKVTTLVPSLMLLLLLEMQ